MPPLTPGDLQRLSAAQRLPPNLATKGAGSDSPEQPAAYRGRWGAPQATNVGALTVNVWTRIDVSVPTVLRFLLVTGPVGPPPAYPGAGASAQYHFVLYTPNRVPESDLWAQTALRGNVVYLSNPGTWWIKVTGAVAGGVVNYLQIDASDPLVAAHYLSIPGQQKIYHQNVQAATGAGAPTTVFAANPWRTALVFQNLATKVLLYRFSSVAADDPVGSLVVANRRGFQLALGATAVIVGDVLTYERLRVCLLDGSIPTADDRIEAWEYRSGIA